MKYRIRIEREDLNADSDYDKYATIYEQVVEDLEVSAVVNLINEESGLEGTTTVYPSNPKPRQDTPIASI